MKPPIRTSYVGALFSLGTASCCVLPMVMLTLGLGGSWLAVFGRISAMTFYVLAIASMTVMLAWVVARRRGVLARLKWRLTGSTVMTIAAWGIALSEVRINEFLIALM